MEGIAGNCATEQSAAAGKPASQAPRGAAKGRELRGGLPRPSERGLATGERNSRRLAARGKRSRVRGAAIALPSAAPGRSECFAEDWPGGGAKQSGAGGRLEAVVCGYSPAGLPAHGFEGHLFFGRQDQVPLI